MNKDQRYHVDSVKSQIFGMTEEQLLEARELLELDIEHMTPDQERTLRREILETR